MNFDEGKLVQLFKHLFKYYKKYYYLSDNLRKKFTSNNSEVTAEVIKEFKQYLKEFIELSEINTYVNELLKNDNMKYTVSIIGNRPMIPRLCYVTFHSSLIPTKTTEGIYIIFFYDFESEKLWLSLNQGIQKLELKFAEKVAVDLYHLIERTNDIRSMGFSNTLEFNLKNKSAEDFSKSNIISKEYDIKNISEKELLDDLLFLNDIYTSIVKVLYDLGFSKWIPIYENWDSIFEKISLKLYNEYVPNRKREVKYPAIKMNIFNMNAMSELENRMNATYTSYLNMLELGGKTENVGLDAFTDNQVSKNEELSRIESDKENREVGIITNETKKVSIRTLAVSDRESNTDLLDSDYLKKPISQLLTDIHTGCPFSIGLYGKWGSGKSTLINLVKDEIEKLMIDNQKVLTEITNHKFFKYNLIKKKLFRKAYFYQKDDLNSKINSLNRKKTYIVKFNASEYDEKEKIWAGILCSLYEEYSTKVEGHRILYLIQRVRNFVNQSDAIIYLCSILLLITVTFGYVVNTTFFNSLIFKKSEELTIPISIVVMSIFFLLAKTTYDLKIGKSKVPNWFSHKNERTYRYQVERDLKCIVTAWAYSDMIKERKRGVLKLLLFPLSILLNIVKKAICIMKTVDVMRKNNLLEQNNVAHLLTNRIVLVIDDLDRCSLNQIQEVNEALKLFRRVDEHLITILSIDSDIVGNAIGAKYASVMSSNNTNLENGKLYLDKYLNLIINIEHLQNIDYKKFVEPLINAIGENNTMNSIITMEELDEVFGDSITQTEKNELYSDMNDSYETLTSGLSDSEVLNDILMEDDDFDIFAENYTQDDTVTDKVDEDLLAISEILTDEEIKYFGELIGSITRVYTATPRLIKRMLNTFIVGKNLITSKHDVDIRKFMVMYVINELARINNEKVSFDVFDNNLIISKETSIGTRKHTELSSLLRNDDNLNGFIYTKDELMRMKKLISVFS
jgi:hypothetical protein